MPIDGRRSTSRTTRGASSAYRSRTTNSSLPRAVERRALARQSIVEIGSPRTYAREPATSVPWPRRRLGEPPNGSPETRYLGTSGNVLRVRAGTLSGNARRRRRQGGQRRRPSVCVADLGRWHLHARYEAAKSATQSGRGAGTRSRHSCWIRCSVSSRVRLRVSARYDGERINL